jgi:hypothetical protein
MVDQYILRCLSIIALAFSTIHSLYVPRRAAVSLGVPSEVVMAERFEIVIVFGVNKGLEVAEDEVIGDVKVRAMALFDIPASDKDQYVLSAKNQKLADTATVRQAKLHPHEKVTLSASAPYGSGS